jgi:hypothetical protein
LFLFIQPSGFKSWVMRFRHGTRTVKIVLGPVALPGFTVAVPAIGKPLSLAQARQMAAEINAERVSGEIDVVQRYRVARERRRALAADVGANSFGAAVKDFVKQLKTKGARETANVLGLDDALKVKPNSLVARWADRAITTISSDDLHAVIDEALSGIPGVETRRDGPSIARQRKLYARLSELFTWLRMPSSSSRRSTTTAFRVRSRTRSIGCRASWISRSRRSRWRSSRLPVARSAARACSITCARR